MSFGSDNWAGASAKIMEAIVAANAGLAPAYGADPWTARAKKAFEAAFDHSLAMVTVPTGTAANSLAIEIGCGRDGLLICHEEAHAIDAEAASRSLLNPGVGIVPVQGVGGKLEAAALDAALRGLSGQTRRRLVSLTNVTEAGLVYRPPEIAALSSVAHEHGATVHLDGARFANAVAASGVLPAEVSWKAGVDLMSFGATKSGALAAEAVVAFDPALEPHMLERRKALGYTFSKGRFIGVQFEAYLESGHWLDLARHANAAAARLAAGFSRLGIRLAWPCEANEVFPILRQAQVAAIRAGGIVCHDWWVADFESPRLKLQLDELIVRFVASFATGEADVERVLSLAGAAIDQRAPAHTG